ncbi:hypothetical protein [Halobellus litoreus]|uniref:Uncharacterized protein n=1 Tax=Halobellus litoreus TaxID=755310 RepID=A0ABD6E001_9EURY|nr:hypothetical protein [Halobellus litoreus]
MSGDGDSIADIVFQRTRTQQLVAEIAFGPALAFAVDQTSPTGIQGAILMWLMAALIGIPILRYLVFTDRIEHFDRLLDLTVRPVELFAILGVVQVFKFLGIEFIQPVTDSSAVGATAVIVVLGVLVYILGFELIFQKYRFSWGTLYYVKRLALEQQIDIQMDDVEEVAEATFQHPSQWARLKAAVGLLRLTLIRITFGQVAFHLLKDSIPERDDEAMDELRSYIEMSREGNSLTDSRGLWFAFGVSAVVVLPLLALMAGLISLVFATFGTIVLVMLIMRLSKHMVALSYIAFGTMDYEQFVTTNKRWFAMIAVYTLSVYLLIFYQF